MLWIGQVLSDLGSQMGWLAYRITREELSEDPRDFLANVVLHSATTFTSHGKWVSVAFLLSHGLIKLFLVWSLYRQKLWAYPVTIVVLLLFIVVQTAEILRHHSLLLTGLTLLDVVIVVLAWHEYLHRKKRTTNS